MTDWIAVKHLPLTQDLSELVQFLRQRGLGFRITEERGGQLLEVSEPAMVEPVTELVDRWLAGELSLPEGDPKNITQAVRPTTLSPLQTPATLGLILVSLAGALLTATEVGRSLLHWFTFQSFTFVHQGVTFEPVGEGIGAGQWWRLLTPAFVHFGLFHIVFNSLWLWELGRRVELLLGWHRYLLVIFAWAIIANVTQFYWGGPGLFGGMSGVVYALVGFIWLRHKLDPHPLLAIPPGIIGFMLVWMALCLSGIVDRFIDGSVANGAHVGGLVIGILWGLVSGARSLRDTATKP